MFRAAGIFGIIYIIPTILSAKIIVRDGNPFIHYIDIGGNQLEKCVLTFNNENISLYPNEINNAISPVKQKLESFEKSACGFKLNNFSEDDPRVFNLTALLQGNATELKNDLIIVYKERTVLNNITDYTNYGEKYYLRKCTASGMKMCYLYSPNGKLVSSGTLCTFVAELVLKAHIGDWKCDIILEGDVTPTTFFIHLTIYKQPRIETWYRKENGYGIVGCKYADRIDNEPLKSCTMYSPQKQALVINEYSATERYITLGTNFSQNVCEFEFKLPAEQNEIGTWTCNLDRRRGFINVEHVSDFPKIQKILASLGQADGRTYVKCDVPYPAIASFAVNPAGEVFYKASYNDSQDGKLYFYTPSTEEQFGVWKCHFAKNNSYEDDIITVNIENFNTVQLKSKEEDVADEEELVILFKANGPITYCIIEDPQGNIYYIQEDTKSEYLEYHGAGFVDGECGITLKNVGASQEGSWKCMMSVVEKTEGFKQFFGQTYVQVVDRNPAVFSKSSVTPYLIGVVGVVIAITVLVMFWQVRKEKRKEHVSPPNSLGTENSENSFVVYPR